jgi:hypothetical protein
MTTGLSDERLSELLSALRLETERRPPADLRTLLRLGVCGRRGSSQVVWLATTTAGLVLVLPLVLPAVVALVGAGWWLICLAAMTWVLLEPIVS